MPRNRASATKSAESEKPVEAEEQVEVGADDMDEEEFEHEEIEEEVEEEEVEEVEEEENDSGKESDGGDDMENPKDEDLERKHAELLALPEHGSEVFLGRIVHDTSEDDLKHYCESIGEVTEVRFMKYYGNKSYASVTFKIKELATKAVKELNNKELKGKKLKCSASLEKPKLFIGNIPRNWGKKYIKKVMNKVGPGVVAVELLKFKSVHVENLPKDVTRDQLKQLFEHHGKIVKVYLPPAKRGEENSQHGFVHFEESRSAMEALNNTEKYEIDGQVIECSLAKPQAYLKTVGESNSQKPAIFPSYPAHM